MASATKSRKYTNVYTILDKIKKGEIQYDNDGDDTIGFRSRFSAIDYFKKDDLVKPHLHYIDERRLTNIVDEYIKDTSSTVKYFDRFRKTAGFIAMDHDQKPGYGQFHKKVQDIYEKFPPHIKYDVFKMFHKNLDNLEFEDRNKNTEIKFRFLEKANNPVGKIMSEGSNTKSAIFARNVMMYFIARMAMLEYTQPPLSQSLQDSLDGDKGSGKDSKDPSGGDNDRDAKTAVEQLFDGKISGNMLEEAMNDAQQQCEALDQNMSEELQEEMFEAASKPGGSGAGKLSPDYISTLTSQLKNINMSLNSLKERIKKLLDKSVNYFSSRQDPVYEDLFNSDNISGLEDYALLHPKLRKIFAEDIQVKDTRLVGKIDLYIDISGSMTGHCGSEGTGYISNLDFCKSIAVKLEELGMLNDVYVFNNSVRKYKKDIISLAKLSTSGGTTINVAVNMIKQNGVNALVLTDAEDRCSVYDEKAFFIGVKGARFSYFDRDTLRKYSDAGQMVLFDGTHIQNVDRNGKPA